MYSQHELSAKFPRMGADEFRSLVEDIKANGLRHPIILFEGKVLDGWNRNLACAEAKVSPQYIKYSGKNPVALVLSENIHRRDLSPSQRALIVVECNDWVSGGRPKTVSMDTVTGRTKEELAADSNTSQATIARAKVVAVNGSESLKQSVREGEATLRTAADIAATTPKRQQAQALKERDAPKPEPKPQAAGPPRQAKPKPAALTVPKAQHDELVEQYNALRENRDDLAAEVEATEALKADEHVIKIKELQFELRACRRARDELMVKVAELTKGVQHWKRKFEKVSK